jgi:hypothetical protein
MEIRDWHRPKGISVGWLLLFASTLPVLRTALEVIVKGRPVTWWLEWARASTMVGILIGIFAFLVAFLIREKHAWAALESKLRGDAFAVEQLREEIEVLRARVQGLDEAPGAADTTAEARPTSEAP